MDLSSLHSYLFVDRSRTGGLPSMGQDHFIMMWKTLYDLFVDRPEDEQLELYHSIATVG